MQSVSVTIMQILLITYQQKWTLHCKQNTASTSALPVNAWVMVWPSGNGTGHINNITPIHGYTALACSQPIRPAQPAALSGWEMSTGHGTQAEHCGWAGNHRSGTSPAIHHLRAQWPKEGRWPPHLHSTYTPVTNMKLNWMCQWITHSMRSGEES